ncbi:HSP90-5 [Scenedesmus sp. PABB004]|nr:HSP90-5 [Scenedesmus sp. PABB004]
MALRSLRSRCCAGALRWQLAGQAAAAEQRPGAAHPLFAQLLAGLRLASGAAFQPSRLYPKQHSAGEAAAFWGLLALNVGAAAAAKAGPPELREALLTHARASVDALAAGRWHTLLASGVVHTSAVHCGLNLLMLLLYRRTQPLSARELLVLYALGSLAGSLTHVAWCWWDASGPEFGLRYAANTPGVLGASGGVAAVCAFKAALQPLGVPHLGVPLPLPIVLATAVYCCTYVREAEYSDYSGKFGAAAVGVLAALFAVGAGRRRVLWSTRRLAMLARNATRAAASQVKPGAAARALPCLRSSSTAARPGVARSLLAVPRVAEHLQSFASRRSVAASAAVAAAEETFTYQAEVDRLMDMIVNSLYSNREVFLRELISNASDALDKVRFVGLTDPKALEGREELEILIKADKDARTITIEDSGIGMTREQLLSNLGTIARSGTRKFMEAVKEAKGDANLIGQFGVGFYSAFLVADRVSVVTKSHEEDAQWVWQSSVGSHQYTIKEDDGPDRLARGTRVVLHLKEDAVELADPVRLAKLIKQYSQFIQFPIKLYSSRKEPKTLVDDAATAKKQEEADKAAQSKGEEKADAVEPVMKTEYEDVWDWRVENENKPLWTRAPRDVAEADYNDFFKQTFGEFLDPLAHVHFNVEGTIEFTSMLFIPGMAPFEQQNWAAKSRSIKLYVRRVFISDEFDENLMPRYLSFIKGVVDSSDLPLNVSREILQESRIVRVIRKQLIRRSLEMIEALAAKEGGEDYKTFWESFGRNIKVGVIEDTENRERLSKLLRFHSSVSEEGMTGLGDYVGRMKDGQKGIFYMAADSVDVARAAPFVEKLVADGYEVLYLTEAIDEAVVTNLAKFGDVELVDVSKEGLTLDSDDAAKLEEASKELGGLLSFLKESLSDRVEKVTLTSRLLDSPCALVTSKFGWSANMERIMRSQAMGDARAMEYMRGRKILEVNPGHEVVRGIKVLLDEDDKERARDLAELLYETSLLTSGFALEAPKDYASKVYTLMKIALGYDAGDAPAAPAAPAAAAAAQAAPAAAAAAPAADAAAQQQQPGAEPAAGGGAASEAVEADVVVEGKGGDPWGAGGKQA